MSLKSECGSPRHKNAGIVFIHRTKRRKNEQTKKNRDNKALPELTNEQAHAHPRLTELKWEAKRAFIASHGLWNGSENK